MLCLKCGGDDEGEEAVFPPALSLQIYYILLITAQLHTRGCLPPGYSADW